jgi:hypothetical protein
MSAQKCDHSNNAEWNERDTYEITHFVMCVECQYKSKESESTEKDELNRAAADHESTNDESDRSDCRSPEKCKKSIIPSVQLIDIREAHISNSW